MRVEEARLQSVAIWLNMEQRGSSAGVRMFQGGLSAKGITDLEKEMCSVYTEVKRRHSSCSRML